MADNRELIERARNEPGPAFSTGPLRQKLTDALEAADAEITTVRNTALLNLKVAKDRGEEIARLTAERDAAIAEIGKTARARGDYVWNEAIEAAAKMAEAGALEYRIQGGDVDGADYVEQAAAAIRELRR